MSLIIGVILLIVSNVVIIDYCAVKAGKKADQVVRHKKS